MSTTRTSAASYASRLGRKEEINFDEMTDEQLRLTLEEAMRTNRTLTLENEVFERYLRRKDPQSLIKLEQVVESARQAQKIIRARADSIQTNRGSSTPSFSSSGQLARDGSQSLGADQAKRGGGVGQAKGLKITIAHRMEMTNRELDDMKKHLEAYEKTIEKKTKNLEARLEEIKCRAAETAEASLKFENEVVNAVDPVSKKIPTEKFSRFVDEQLKLARARIDKLNLKIVTAKRLIHDTKKQIQQQEEVGNSLRPVDFDKLRIENEYIIEENEENHKLITSLKQISGYYNHCLKDKKERLMEHKTTLRVIEKKLQAREQENAQLRRDQARTKREVNKELAHLREIKRLQEKYEIPEVADFLEVQKQLQDAKKSFKTLSRRRKLQLSTIRTSRNSESRK